MFNNIYTHKLEVRSPKQLTQLFDITKLENLCAKATSFLNICGKGEDQDNANANLKNYRKTLDILNKKYNKET